MSRNVTTGMDTRSRMLQGALQMAKAVGVTYGPYGRTCMLDRAQGLLATKDGVTVAREIVLDDPIANQGALILRDACLKVNDDVGDGTTSVAILAAEMIREGHRMVTAGMDPNSMIRGMNAARDQALQLVEDLAVPVSQQSELTHVAMIASNGDDDIARCMAEACMAAGRDGTVIIEDGQGIDTSLEFKEGMEIDRGPLSSVFLGASNERTMDGPLVAIVNAELRTVDDVRDVLETSSQWAPRELLLIALSVSGDALATLTLNHSKGIVKCCAVQCPGFGFHRSDYLQDIAALTGATFIDPAAGMDHRVWNGEWFGALRKAAIRHKATVMEAYPEASETIQARIRELRAAEAHSVSDYDRDRFKERAAKLGGCMAVLRIGGLTEAAMKERRARVEDALGAVRAALRDGVVPGSGIAYLYAGNSLGSASSTDESWNAGWKIMVRALRYPATMLLDNAGFEGRAIVELIPGHSDGNPWIGWDVHQKRMRDLAAEPLIIDPTAVVTSVIRAATSVATTLLTVETSITQASPNGSGG